MINLIQFRKIKNSKTQRLTGPVRNYLFTPMYQTWFKLDIKRELKYDGCGSNPFFTCYPYPDLNPVHVSSDQNILDPEHWLYHLCGTVCKGRYTSDQIKGISAWYISILYLGDPTIMEELWEKCPEVIRIESAQIHIVSSLSHLQDNAFIRYFVSLWKAYKKVINICMYGTGTLGTEHIRYPDNDHTCERYQSKSAILSATGII